MLQYRIIVLFLSQNYSLFKITTVNNSCCPSYASYLAKSARFTSALQTGHVKQSNHFACNFAKSVPILKILSPANSNLLKSATWCNMSLFQTIHIKHAQYLLVVCSKIIIIPKLSTQKMYTFNTYKHVVNIMCKQSEPHNALRQQTKLNTINFTMLYSRHTIA